VEISASKRALISPTDFSPSLRNSKII